MIIDREMIVEMIAGFLIGGMVIALFFLASIHPGNAEGWESGDAELDAFFQNPVVKRCCDRRDVYLADLVSDDGNGGYVAIVTNGSADPRYNKPSIPNGTRIPVPQERFVKEPRAPGGRGLIFLAKGDIQGNEDTPPEKRFVYCYFPPPLF